MLSFVINFQNHFLLLLVPNSEASFSIFLLLNRLLHFYRFALYFIFAVIAYKLIKGGEKPDRDIQIVSVLTPLYVSKPFSLIPYTKLR